MIFIDTSVFLAILNIKDINHEKAKEQWKKAIKSDKKLICSNYILVETTALLQNRSGVTAVRIFQEDILPVLIIEWIDPYIHQIGLKSLITANRRELSFVDCTSFEIMRKSGIKLAFTFDKHFKEQGFLCIPEEN